MARDPLETPRGGPGGPAYDPDFGRAAERFARFFGTPRYIVIQSVLVVLWITLNVLEATKTVRFDRYPFILLNLMFSTQAAYAAPLILLAQNRQADRDKAEIERDRDANARAFADMEYLAREIAAVRLTLEHKADREDLIEPVNRLTSALEAFESPRDPEPGTW
ncbi:MAG TPA: DUF1003 domain-containing protein [Solirubrobacteraceae bacterium]|nr:DUF1003 domain-containing protein [Solirubrobacteraceae bacterium]